VQELEKWLVVMLNNLYEANPFEQVHLEQALRQIEDLQNEKLYLKRLLLLEKLKVQEAQQQSVDS